MDVGLSCRARGRSAALTNTNERHSRAVAGSTTMFRLITTVRRGSASGLAPTWARYPTLEAARAGAALLLRMERVMKVMIVRNEMPPAFVEWAGAVASD